MAKENDIIDRIPTKQETLDWGRFAEASPVAAARNYVKLFPSHTEVISIVIIKGLLNEISTRCRE